MRTDGDTGGTRVGGFVREAQRPVLVLQDAPRKRAGDEEQKHAKAASHNTIPHFSVSRALIAACLARRFASSSSAVPVSEERTSRLPLTP